jgi:hypothetical protein
MLYEEKLALRYGFQWFIVSLTRMVPIKHIREGTAHMVIGLYMGFDNLAKRKDFISLPH